MIKPLRPILMVLVVAASAIPVLALASAPQATWVGRGTPPASLVGPVVFALDGRTVLVAGGYHGGHLTNESEIYDAVSDKWTVTPDMPGPRLFGAGIALADGSGLIFGGSIALRESQKTGVVYDRTSGSWLTTGPMPKVVGWDTASVLIPSGKALIVGGADENQLPLDAIQAFDPSTRSWSQVGSLKSPRAGAAVVLLPSGKVLIAGGKDNRGTLASAEVYDPGTRQSVSVSDMTVPRWKPAAVRLQDGLVLVAGGASQQTAEIFDEGTGSWTTQAPLPVSGVSQGFLLSGNRVVVTTYVQSEDRRLHVSAFDPRANDWSAGPDLQMGSSLETAVMVRDTVLVIAGSDVSAFKPAPTGPKSPGHIAVSLANSQSTTAFLLAISLVLLLGVGLVHLRSRLTRPGKGIRAGRDLLADDRP